MRRRRSWARGVKSPRGGSGHGVRDGAARLGPRGEAAVKDAHRIEPIGPQAPPRAGGVQAGRVVVDDDGRAVADAGRRRGRSPTWSGGPRRSDPSGASWSVSAARQSRCMAPGMCPSAKTTRPAPSGRQRTSRTRTSWRPRFSASQSGDARSSGRAWAPDIAPYHTDPMADPMHPIRRHRRRARRSRLRAREARRAPRGAPGDAGGHLPQHRHERAAAGRGGGGDGRGGRRASSRSGAATLDAYEELVARMDEARARRGGGPRHGRGPGGPDALARPRGSTWPSERSTGGPATGR